MVQLCDAGQPLDDGHEAIHVWVGLHSGAPVLAHSGDATASNHGQEMSEYEPQHLCRQLWKSWSIRALDGALEQGATLASNLARSSSHKRRSVSSSLLPGGNTSSSSDMDVITNDTWNRSGANWTTPAPEKSERVWVR